MVHIRFEVYEDGQQKKEKEKEKEYYQNTILKYINRFIYIK